MERGAWRATVHGVAKSQDLTDHTRVHQGTGCNWKRRNFQFLKSEKPMRPCLSEGWLKGRDQGREDWSKAWGSQEDLGEQSNWHNQWNHSDCGNWNRFQGEEESGGTLKKISQQPKPKIRQPQYSDSKYGKRECESLRNSLMRRILNETKT